MEYNFREIEQKWQRYWDEAQTYRVEIQPEKPKYYVLDMFPYPSGAGLHVGHPLGYIASDIVSRYRRMRGFNVLHPMGFDSFGLPAEQYAIQTGTHPAITTEKNIETYIRQLKQLGFSYDWSREVRTSDPRYYKWTQWIFQQLFRHYYDRDADRALPIEELTRRFAEGGSAAVNAVCDEDAPSFTAEEWRGKTERERYEITLKYRLTYLADAVVNWCPALGTVLANDEVKDGVSERGGYPVEQKLMRQWMMRITAYADRLLAGLDTIDWPESLKEQQRNWIGRSQGASVRFRIADLGLGIGENSVSALRNPQAEIEVFTTRLDTIFGVTFMVLAPEHELVPMLTSPDQREAVEAYVEAAKRRSERDRMAEAKTVSGVFTGSYCVNPFNGEKVPIFLADYVLAGYGTGAVMAVPSGDQRDYLFARHFDLPIVQILDAQQHLDQQADNTKEGRYVNSGFINGLTYAEAMPKLLQFLEERGIGRGKIQYRMRNAVFSRQRYWGEPVPVYFRDGLPYLIDEADLPLQLPPVDKYLPTETGEPPLGRAEGWKYTPNPLKGATSREGNPLQGAGGEAYDYELSTMPGWAGSSWYWYRYMDPQNDQEFASKEAIDYWRDVDLYLGGSEHATGHLLYSRFWNKFLKDIGLVPEEEFAKKLVNQGMIQGRSNFVYRVKDSEQTTFVSFGLKDQYDVTPLHVDVNLVENDVLDLDAFKASPRVLGMPEDAEFILEEGKYVCGWEIEKMSKSKFNVVNPDTIVEKYGADTLRLYEMFLGPLTDSKPWNTHGISGTFNFLRKFWRLFYQDETGRFLVTDEQPTPEELKALHKAIKKVGEDIEALSFNTSVPAFMVLANELSALKCHKRAILSEFVLILAPFAPHVAEELWAALGNEPGSVSRQPFPQFNPAYLVESSFEYPVQINGKVRVTMNFPLDTVPADIEREVLANETVQKWLEGKAPKKVVVVPKRIVNVVV
jgi:leucyl-tRNA synthetase